MPLISTDCLSYDRKTKTFACCVSDFGKTFAFCRIYSDAEDLGLTLVSDRSGLEATYYIDHIEYDQEGDLTEWVLKPTPESVRKIPQVRDTSLIIFND